MKKNLQKVLVLALGLTTTIASAQWSAESRTRVEQDSDNATDNRINVSATWGGIHASYDVNYDFDGDATHDVYEAYVSTDLMGMATLTVGRQDLSFGSGALMSSNSWGMERYTNDGFSLSANYGGIDLNAGTLDGRNRDNRYINAGGEFGGATFNVLMMSDGGNDAHGYDIGYSLMGGDLGLSYSMNSDYDGDEMTAMGATYSMGDLGVSYTRTDYDGAFNMNNTAMSGGWTNGVLGYQDAGDEVTSMGLSYNVMGIDLGYTMHSITDADGNDTDASAISLGYSLNDNASIGVLRIDDNGTETNWITLTIRP